MDSRIRGDRDYFASLPEDVQENLRLGQVEIGYTKRMVEIALGSPDRVSRRVTAEGEVEVWDYVRTRPSIGIGVGTGSYGRRGGVGGGVSVGTGGGREVQASVTFRNDEVVSVERPG
ncbi:MAG: hypothetical protein EA425_00280 [Puniceicoccaceae bacterium]|nr:MAG: hypothetical protein EA425_00280 [Puniceicoccaceae bacterium]